jgi:hypothetical protein
MSTFIYNWNKSSQAIQDEVLSIINIELNKQNSISDCQIHLHNETINGHDNNIIFFYSKKCIEYLCHLFEYDMKKGLDVVSDFVVEQRFYETNHNKRKRRENKDKAFIYIAFGYAFKSKEKQNKYISLHQEFQSLFEAYKTNFDITD